jgi:hypothetical protein
VSLLLLDAYRGLQTGKAPFQGREFALHIGERALLRLAGGEAAGTLDAILVLQMQHKRAIGAET